MVRLSIEITIWPKYKFVTFEVFEICVYRSSIQFVYSLVPMAVANLQCFSPAPVPIVFRGAGPKILFLRPSFLISPVAQRNSGIYLKRQR